MTRIPAVAVATLLTAALLTSCSAAPSPAASGAAGGDPTPTSTPTAQAIEPADSCLSIDTGEETVDGNTLGTCFAEVLTLYGTAKAHSELGGDVNDAEFRLGSDPAIHATGVGPDGRTEVVYVDRIAYRDEGGGWVKGDPDSDDPDEMVIGGAGKAMLALFSGEMLRQSIAACPVWNIETAPKKLTLPDDKVVETRVFSCAAPFEMFGTTVSPMAVWIDDDWTPYGSESTATGFGQTVSGVTLYYDHGQPVEIEAPM